MKSVYKKPDKKGFTLVEVVAATTILALISSSVWVVVDRCVTSTANTKLKLQAFETARENMETILSKASVKETVEYGASDKYPGIEWENIVETFYEPINSQMWLRAVCNAMYYDMSGQKQSVELVHWLTGLTKEQLLQILSRQEESQDKLKPQLLEAIEDAAAYAGVTDEVIQQWLDNGMLTTADGFFVKNNLDLYKLNNGSPGKEDQKLQIASEEDLRRFMTKQKQKEMQNEIDPATGLTYGQMEQMNIQEIWDIIKNKRNGEQ
ncbi:MAG: prepilin-type N-terminal cleavage/methylation domain-containing protein [Sedimentisphaerales bacterium]|nr:prepilin-type N-terminal cleavage/methylation domain-containing protein [Sedimentisphaerales bacterium]